MEVDENNGADEKGDKRKRSRGRRTNTFASLEAEVVVAAVVDEKECTGRDKKDDEDTGEEETNMKVYEKKSQP